MDLRPGATIGGRYRIQSRAWSSGVGAVWKAFDSTLERAVLFQTFPGVDEQTLAHVVARVAQINHPGVSQLYDMCTDPPGIVFENAPAGRLADRIDGAMPAARAAAVVSQLAAAIAALHERGIPHGAIGPETVLFDEEGRPKLSAAGVSEEVDRPTASMFGPVPASYRDPSGSADAAQRDRYALGAIAYHLFTGREPGPDAPPARVAKRTVPPQVDALLSRALARDASVRPRLDEFRRVLDPIASAEPPERGAGFFRQEATWLVPVLLVTGLAVGAIVIGIGSGAIHFGRQPKSTASQSPAAASLKVESVVDFDPPPKGNGEEHHDQVDRVIDDKDTAWSTFGYTNAAFGGQKQGVGLLFDLGTSRSVGRILVRTPIEGWRAEWRIAETQGSHADDYALAGPSFEARGDPIVFEPPARGRYWLLWITRLVPNGTSDKFKYQAQVSEVSFYAP